MGALTADRNTRGRSGQVLEPIVKLNAEIFAGAMVATDVNGEAVPASDTAALHVRGCATEHVVGDGVLRVKVDRTLVRRYANSVGDALAAADIGGIAYVEDDQTVNKTGGANHIKSGKVIDLDAAGVWVDHAQAAN